ncbi:HAD family hydrolase [Oceanobacillus halophilus]|uniref:HAD family phosphatase n=1 Tax=Oceanobacillus halophilus TaxID=930130 RepID=A0A495A8G0_9BACI|nr:HAD family hydrolase [Oceanobacillus halophilus]RKQ35645.1 HAD family phosphatase [Oceanobacillus halophilus]
MTYKAVFLDIDGTILRPDHTYSNKTKDAIIQLQEQDIEVFLATGRPIHEIKELAQELNIDSFIGYNGAHAIYNNETIVDEPMHKDHVNQFVNISMEQNHEIVMYTNRKNYFTNPDSPTSQHFKEAFQMNKNEKYTSEIANQILGMTVMTPDPTQNSLYQLDENIRLSQVNINGLKHAYDVIRNNVNKGEAIKKSLQRLNIPIEQAIAFGDGMNDKEMLQAVGEGFAMGNANPDLFQYAKHRTTTVSEDGIFYGLEKLGLLK